MNKTTLLTAGLVIGVVIAISYDYLGSDIDLNKNPQGSHQEKSTVPQIMTQSSPLNSKAKLVTLATGNDSEQKTALVNENRYARTPPPPPIRSNHKKDGSYTVLQAHGHEKTHDNHKKNSPPPPAGAN